MINTDPPRTPSPVCTRRPLPSHPSSATPTMPPLPQNTTPTKTSNKRTITFASEGYSPPTYSSEKRTKSIIPSTPCKKQQEINMEQLFPPPLDTVADSGVFEFSSTAYAHNGIRHCLVQQEGAKGCAAGALFMLMGDLIRSRQIPSNMSTDVCRQYLYECEMGNDEELKRKAKDFFNVNLGCVMLPKTKEIETLQKHLTNGHSLIIGITHNKLEGHWVVLDAIENESLFIRDPFTGNAYEIPIKDMRKYFKFQGGFEKCLFVESISSPQALGPTASSLFQRAIASSSSSSSRAICASPIHPNNCGPH
jgi:hypothetical protein